jgi:hypothetical protein
MAPARIKDLCLDAGDHQALADWWSTVLGYRRADDPDVADDDASGPDRGSRPASDPVLLLPGPDGGLPLWINPVPEPKTAKNRMHVDVYGDTAELLAAGAVLLRRDEGNGWDVLADPEGNEFCVFPAPS